MLIICRGVISLSTEILNTIKLNVNLIPYCAYRGELYCTVYCVPEQRDGVRCFQYRRTELSSRNPAPPRIPRTDRSVASAVRRATSFLDLRRGSAWRPVAGTLQMTASASVSCSVLLILASTYLFVLCPCQENYSCECERQAHLLQCISILSDVFCTCRIFKLTNQQYNLCIVS